MSRFYGNVRGQSKTEATRTGSASSGIEGHLRGWDIGVYVVGTATADEDVFRVYGTYGSNGEGSNFYICSVKKEDGKVVVDEE